MSAVTYVTIKNLISRKPLHPFTEVLDSKKKTVVRRSGAAKSKQKAIYLVPQERRIIVNPQQGKFSSPQTHNQSKSQR